MSYYDVRVCVWVVIKVRLVWLWTLSRPGLPSSWYNVKVRTEHDSLLIIYLLHVISMKLSLYIVKLRRVEYRISHFIDMYYCWLSDGWYQKILPRLQLHFSYHTRTHVQYEYVIPEDDENENFPPQLKTEYTSEVQLRRLTVGLAAVFHADQPAWQREATRDEGSHQGLVQTAAYNWASTSDRHITGTWQHTHDAWCRVWHAKIYVLKLKCQHEGAARVLTFQLQDIYICVSHESIMRLVFCHITH